jgi:O-antigen/teichoic acid export membrane protein
VVRKLPWVDVLVRLEALADDVGDPRDDFSYPPLIVMISFSAVFAIQAAFLCYRRRWRQLKLLVVGLVLVTLTIAIVGVYNDSRGMNPIEHYSWSGWYWVVIFGTPLTGLLVLAWQLLRLIARLIRRTVRRLFARPAIA